MPDAILRLAARQRSRLAGVFSCIHRAARLALDMQAAPALRKALAESRSLEARRRIEQLLERLRKPLSASELLRSVRAIEVLEHIGNAEARALLKALAGGDPAARQTQEVAGALKRLAVGEKSR